MGEDILKSAQRDGDSNEFRGYNESTDFDDAGDSAPEETLRIDEDDGEEQDVKNIKMEVKMEREESEDETPLVSKFIY